MTTIAQQLQAEARNGALTKAFMETCANHVYRRIIDCIKRNECQWYDEFTTIDVHYNMYLEEKALHYVEFYYTLDPRFEAQLVSLLAKNGFKMCSCNLDGTLLKTITLKIS